MTQGQGQGQGQRQGQRQPRRGYPHKWMAPHRASWAINVLCLAAAALPSAAAAQDAADAAEAGRKLYISGCQRCHGINLATNGIGYDLRQFPQHDKERFVRAVVKGLRAMPAWGDTLKPEQIDLIWLYVGTVNGWKAISPAPK